MNSHPRTVEDVINDFKGRRAGIIKALTKDVEQFYQLCNPNYPSLCLYGFPNQQWEVNLPPPNSDLPEPRLGINLVRDVMNKHEWLSMVALHSDAWLHSIAAFYAAKFKFEKGDRKRLFNKITDVSSVLDAMTGESRKRRKKELEGFLPEELIIEVLSRVPVRDLVKYRSVCKRWRAMIDDHEFVSTHLSTYKRCCEGSHLLVIERPKSWLKNEQFLVRRSDTFRKVFELDNEFNGQGNINDLSYINGVMLIRREKFRALDDIILWNPSIKRSLNVSDSAFQDLREATYFELGLGFDPSKGDLKVVAIVYPHAEVKYYRSERYRGTVPGLVQVYTLGNKSWSSNIGVQPPPYWSVGAQVFVNGCIHWTNLGPEIRDSGSWNDKKDSHIVSFDVSNEVFKYINLPKEVVDRDGEMIMDKFPIVLEGLLGMFYSYGSHHDVWVMEEYGVPNSWSKRYKFMLYFDNLLYVKSNGVLLFALDGKGIKSFDIKTNWVRDLAKTYSKSINYSIYTYVESLLLGCK